MDATQKILGVSMPFQVGTRMVEVHPVMVKDWPRFADNLAILYVETLQEVYILFSDGPTRLEECFLVTTRLEEIPALFYDMTQSDYQRYREMVIDQNGLKFDKKEEKGKDGKN